MAGPIRLAEHCHRTRQRGSSSWTLAGIFSVLAEYERSIISEKTKAGMQAAKARGKQIGKSPRCPRFV